MLSALVYHWNSTFDLNANIEYTHSMDLIVRKIIIIYFFSVSTTSISNMQYS
ncbi:MAG: hypothetical protein MUW56_15990 [Chryseobacterium sp.]|uniref:hypothetical protein n=1 Tax=Chryseobacterium sp. TaxID=1871047 RepID=UPI0025C43616|nr:hypothetical protein [Chryseobacterium sp.]MCJ7935074.1 hypothetical protein [Chryseobacterium sp.]